MTQALFWIAPLLLWGGPARGEIVLTPPKVYSGAVYTGKGTTEMILPSDARPEARPDARPNTKPSTGSTLKTAHLPPPKGATPRSKNPPSRLPAKKGFTDVIDSAIARHRGDFKACFEKQAKLNPALQGLVVVQFSISEYGKVHDAKIKSSTLGHAKVERCVLDSIAAINEFPQPGNGMTLQATYPFNFVVRAVQ